MTGESRRGIGVFDTSGAVCFYTDADVTAPGDGISILSSSENGLTVGGAGVVTASGGNGIFVSHCGLSSSGSIRITGAGATRAAMGFGVGALVANVSNDAGIFMNRSGPITAGRDGIQATTHGGGDIQISDVGDMRAGRSAVNHGIKASAAGGSIRISTEGAISAGQGIQAETAGFGQISIQSKGLISACGNGIYARLGAGTGCIHVHANGPVDAIGYGILAASCGTGGVIVDGSADILGTHQAAIQAANYGELGSDDVVVSGTGSTTSVESIGISALVFDTSNDADIIICRSGQISARTIGISASTNGLGSVTVAGEGAVVAGTIADDLGIQAIAKGGDVLVSRKGVISSAGGIFAATTGEGAIQINAGDDVVASLCDGIVASGERGSIVIEVAAVITAAGVGVALIGGAANRIVNSGVISGAIGIAPTGGATHVMNAGTIIGKSGTSIQFGGSENTLTLTPTSAITGTTCGSGTDVLELGGSGLGTFDAGELGEGKQYRGFATVSKIEASTWSVHGESDFAGPVFVEEGTLSIAGSLTRSEFSVHAGARLRGSGVVGPITVHTEGIVAADGPAAKLSVHGDMSMAARSVLQVEISPAGENGCVFLTGVASLDDGIIEILGAPAPGRYKLLVARGGIRGSFTQVRLDDDNLALSAALCCADGNEIYVEIAQRDLSNVISLSELRNLHETEKDRCLQ